MHDFQFFSCSNTCWIRVRVRASVFFWCFVRWHPRPSCGRRVVRRNCRPRDNLCGMIAVLGTRVSLSGPAKVPGADSPCRQTLHACGRQAFLMQMSSHHGAVSQRDWHLLFHIALYPTADLERVTTEHAVDAHPWYFSEKHINQPTNQSSNNSTTGHFEWIKPLKLTGLFI